MNQCISFFDDCDLTTTIHQDNHAVQYFRFATDSKVTMIWRRTQQVKDIVYKMFATERSQKWWEMIKWYVRWIKVTWIAELPWIASCVCMSLRVYVDICCDICGCSANLSALRGTSRLSKLARAPCWLCQAQELACCDFQTFLCLESWKVGKLDSWAEIRPRARFWHWFWALLSYSTWSTQEMLWKGKWIHWIHGCFLVIQHLCVQTAGSAFVFYISDSLGLRYQIAFWQSPRSLKICIGVRVRTANPMLSETDSKPI